ncbi:MAG TPA: hypothetical protein VM286_00345 [Candidatus Thermoplasmatota archaeon]|nr:hypothetical protein [Candidatus Thermoplasmatota archaeon]
MWTGTQPLGNQLYFEFGGQSIQGDSPLKLRLTQAQLAEAGDDGDVMARVFAGDVSPTVVINQEYNIFVQYFYNFVPREDYTFVKDGQCDPASVCK